MLLAELLACPGVVERVTFGSRVGFLALHGGLEEGTAEIAAAAAHAAGASFYAVVQPADLRWHIPSHRYDPDHADGLAEFLAHVDVVVSVHGFGGLRGADDRWTTALLGGGNRELAMAITRELRTALPQYRWVDELDVIPAHLRGLHPANPVNRARNGGVQIELPPRVRREPDLALLVDALAAAVRG
ncbi:MAG: poly-gamma-glutamate hydrolase family protein [Actinomycetota bacterium]